MPNMAPNTTGSITINVTAPSEPGTLTNMATVSSQTHDPNTANNTSSVNTPVTGSADLSITKTDNPDPVTAGSALTYTLTVSNAGPSTATSLTVTDALPASVTFVSLSAAGWSCATGQTVTCSRSSLAPNPNTSSTIAINVRPNQPGTISNTATVSSATNDPNPANNSSTATTTVNSPATSADLMISKADRPDPVATNATLVYTLTARNNGPNTAMSVTVTDNLPSTVTFQSASGSGWNCGRSGQTVTCTRSSLNAGATSTITITVTAPSQPGTIVNTASITSATFDPTPGNNSDSETTTVIQQVTPAKWTGAGKIKVNGGFASFAFTVKKKKNGVVQGQMDFDNLVTKLDVDSISVNTLTVSGNTATFTGTVRERVRNGQWSGPYDFTVTVQDNADPGKGRDTFQIQINDPFNTNESGPLTQGNIENSGFDSRDDRDDRE